MNVMNTWFRLRTFLAVISILGLSSACGNLIPVTGNIVANTVTLSDCYQVQFLGVSKDAEGASTWRYQVEEQSCAQDLSNWTLEIPACATVLKASPYPWEGVQLDPGLSVKGIQWQTATEFKGGDFTVTLSGTLRRGPVHVGVNGSNVAIGEIQGPTCDPNALMPTTTSTLQTSTSIITTTPTITASSTVTVTPSIPFRFQTPTYNPAPTSSRRSTRVPTREPTLTPAPTDVPTDSPTETAPSPIPETPTIPAITPTN